MMTGFLRMALKLEVGKKYKIKTYRIRPDGWASNGAMDIFMGQIVTISSRSADGLNARINEDDGAWYWTTDNFESVDYDWET
jgi:hypothetical protein